VYKGIEFQAHAHLYYLPQKIAEDPKLCSNTRINNIKKQLEELEDKIISRTKQSISPEEQNMGKLIQCLPSDAKNINDTSSCFFNIIQDICQKADLTKMIYTLPIASAHQRRQDIAREKILPGIVSQRYFELSLIQKFCIRYKSDFSDRERVVQCDFDDLNKANLSPPKKMSHRRKDGSKVIESSNKYFQFF